MKIRRSLFTLGAAMLAGVWSSSPANAQTAIMASTTSSTSTSSTTTTTATTALVPIYGMVNGAPEIVAFWGQAQLKANVVTDPDFGKPPTVVLSIDLSNVSGVGLSTGKRYVTSSQGIFNRPLAVADTVQLAFPFFLSGSGGGALSSRVGRASFNLSFDVNTMKLTGATAQIAP